MKVFLEGGYGNGEYIESAIDNPFLIERYKIIIPVGVMRKEEYEMANPFRLRKGAIVFIQAGIEIPSERLEKLYD